MIDKLKELTKDTAVYGVSTIVGRFLNFLLVPFYTNVFTTAQFGIYTNIYAYLAFLNIVYIYGMDAAYLKYASIEKKSKKKIFSTAFLFVTLSTAALTLIFYLFRAPIARAMLVPDKYTHLINYVILILIFDTLALIPFGNLRLERKSVKFSIIKVLNICINLVLNIYLILVQKWGIEAIFFSNLAASVFSFVALIPEIVKYLRLKIDGESLKLMLKFGLPYLPASIAAIMVQVIDRPIVLMLTDNSTLGVYQANYKLGVFMMLFVSMFQYAWQPFLLNNAGEKNAKEIFAKVLSLFVLVASAIWVTLTLFIGDLARIEIWHGRTIIGRDFLGGLYIVPVILLAYIFHGMYVNFNAGIYIEEKTKYLPFITGGGALINVVSNLLLIPIWGILGAAFSTLFSYMFMSGSLFFTVQKFYRVNYDYKRIGKIFLIILIIAGVNYLLYFNHVLTIGAKVLLLLTYFALLIFGRVISKSELKMLGEFAGKLKSIF